MRFVLQTGAHYTEQDRLIQTLLRNKDKFAKHGVLVPPPETYRGLLRDTLNAMHRTPLGTDAQDVVKDAIVADKGAERVILSDPNFFRTAGTAVQNGVLYPAAPQRMAYMAQLFPQDALEVYLIIRNPAALLSIFHSVAQDPSARAFWGDDQPQDLKWSDTIADIRSAAPEIPVTVCCNEDLPLVWSQVIRDMAGIGPHEKIAGGYDLLHTIMSAEGMQRFRSYLGNHPTMSELQKRRVIMAFLDTFALEDKIEEELDMPGWTEDTVDYLSALYDEDLAVIKQIPGVTVLMP